MRVVLSCHSLSACWNHGNAHFPRGVAREQQARGHAVRVLEPDGGRSWQSRVREQGRAALEHNRRAALPGAPERVA